MKRMVPYKIVREIYNTDDYRQYVSNTSFLHESGIMDQVPFTITDNNGQEHTYYRSIPRYPNAKNICRNVAFLYLHNNNNPYLRDSFTVTDAPYKDFATNRLIPIDAISNYTENEFWVYYTITFLDRNNNVVEERQVLRGTAAGAPPVAPTVDGYNFVSWRLLDEEGYYTGYGYSPTTGVTGNKTYKAFYEYNHAAEPGWAKWGWAGYGVNDGNDGDGYQVYSANNESEDRVYWDVFDITRGPYITLLSANNDGINYATIDIQVWLNETPADVDRLGSPDLSGKIYIGRYNSGSTWKQYMQISENLLQYFDIKSAGSGLLGANLHLINPEHSDFSSHFCVLYRLKLSDTTTYYDGTNWQSITTPSSWYLEAGSEMDRLNAAYTTPPYIGFSWNGKQFGCEDVLDVTYVKTT